MNSFNDYFERELGITLPEPRRQIGRYIVTIVCPAALAISVAFISSWWFVEQRVVVEIAQTEGGTRLVETGGQRLETKSEDFFKFVIALASFGISVFTAIGGWVVARLFRVDQVHRNTLLLFRALHSHLLRNPSILASRREGISYTTLSWIAVGLESTPSENITTPDPGTPNYSPISQLFQQQANIQQLLKSLRRLDGFDFALRRATEKGVETSEIVGCLLATRYGSRNLGVADTARTDQRLLDSIAEAEESFEREWNLLIDTVKRMTIQAGEGEERDEVFNGIYDYLEMLKEMDRIMPGSREEMLRLQRFFLVPRSEGASKPRAAPASNVAEATAYAQVARETHGPQSLPGRVRDWWQERSSD